MYLYQQKRKPGAKVVTSKLWRGRYKLPGDLKWRDVKLETTDKIVAGERLRRIVREAEHEREGFTLPKTIREGISKPWDEVSRNYVEQATIGCNTRYVEGLSYQLKALGRECGWMILRDVTADSFCVWRNRNRAQKAVKTLNEYLTAGSAMLGWLVKRRILSANPLGEVDRIPMTGEKTLVRRALSVEEIMRLLAVAGLRCVVYLVALKTGLRRGELEKLRWADVVLEGKKPMIRLRASVSKNRRTAEQPLDAELVRELRALRGAAPDSAKVFDRLIPRMPRFRDDLEAAQIPFEDECGRRVDFHALRMTYNMLIDIAGANGRTAMELMRHSDPKLTFDNYNDRTTLPKWEVVNSLPTLLAKDDSDTRQRTHLSDFSGPGVSPAVTDTKISYRPESLMDKGFWPEMAPNGTYWQNGEMVRAAGFEPATSCV